MRGKALKSCAIFAIGLMLAAGTADLAAAQAAKGPSGLPLPRFVTLKSKRVNLRIGPSSDYAVSWLYLKQNMITGGACAMPTARKAGSTSRCCRVSVRPSLRRG